MGTRKFDHWAAVFRNTRKNAARRQIGFELASKDFAALRERADGLCEMTGIKFSWDRHPGAVRRPFAPSIDRIRNGEGYSPNNVRLVCVAINLAMNQWGDQVFGTIARGYLFGTQTLTTLAERHTAGFKCLPGVVIRRKYLVPMYAARVVKDGKPTQLGVFKTQEEAYQCWLAAQEDHDDGIGNCEIFDGIRRYSNA